jgi:hypothetical protein
MDFRKIWTKLFSKNEETEEIELHVSGATVRHRNPFENIAVPRNEEALSQEFMDKWVTPFYMTDLSNPGNSTIKAFADISKEVSIDIVSQLLGDFNWRTRITGSYFAAVKNYMELEDIIGRHLLKSEVSYAGLGYCLALDTFATDNSKSYLKKYLDYYLDRKDLYFDQAQAYCAFEYLDKNAANQLKHKWDLFTSDKPNWNLDSSRKHFLDCMLTLSKIRQSESGRYPS